MAATSLPRRSGGSPISPTAAVAIRWWNASVPAESSGSRTTLCLPRLIWTKPAPTRWVGCEEGRAGLAIVVAAGGLDLDYGSPGVGEEHAAVGAADALGQL